MFSPVEESLMVSQTSTGSFKNETRVLKLDANPDVSYNLEDELDDLEDELLISNL